MSRVIVIHFSPPELYPPIQNLMKVVETVPFGSSVILITTASTVSNKVLPKFDTSVKTYRLSCKLFSKGVLRLLNYLLFYFGALALLIRYAPRKVLYVETISSWPALVYKKFINQRCSIFVHYHEYTSPEEYENGMTINRYFHKLEKSMFGQIVWLSHTNEYRMALFANDILPLQIPNKKILPNFPPKSWYRTEQRSAGFPIRLVYVGALSLETMYVQEFVRWVIAQQGKVIWNIYSYNHGVEVKKYFGFLNSPYISFFDGLEYRRLPEVLNIHDVGVILYKGHIPNYTYNAPNKLFEYLACQLDVWFPSQMIGTIPYVTTNTYPKVVAIDFDDIPDLEVLTDKEGLVFHLPAHFAEEALDPLIHELQA